MWLVFEVYNKCNLHLSRDHRKFNPYFIAMTEVDTGITVEPWHPFLGPKSTILVACTPLKGQKNSQKVSMYL